MSSVLGSVPRFVGRAVAGGALCLIVVFMTVSSASAQTYTGVPPPDLNAGRAPAVVQQAPARSLRVASVPSPRSASVPVHALPLTGTDVVSLLALGGVLVFSGLVVARSSRTRSAS